MQECMQRYPELYPQEDDNDGAPPQGGDEGGVAVATPSTDDSNPSLTSGPGSALSEDAPSTDRTASS